ESDEWKRPETQCKKGRDDREELHRHPAATYIFVEVAELAGVASGSFPQIVGILNAIDRERHHAHCHRNSETSRRPQPFLPKMISQEEETHGIEEAGCR